MGHENNLGIIVEVPIIEGSSAGLVLGFQFMLFGRFFAVAGYQGSWQQGAPPSPWQVTAIGLQGVH